MSELRSSVQNELPTVVQDIAVRLVFKVMGEEQINRTYDEYMNIANRLPPLKRLHHQINLSLNAEHESLALPQICRFKAGDEVIYYERTLRRSPTRRYEPRW